MWKNFDRRISLVKTVFEAAVSLTNRVTGHAEEETLLMQDVLETPSSKVEIVNKTSKLI